MDGDNPGLRERKKLRTREVVRREAFRLFEKQGYNETTVDQIAEAAEVSPRTFFRYFPSKAAVLVPGQLLEPIIELFVAAPAELSPISAYRHAITLSFTGIPGADWIEEMSRQQLLYAVPEAAGALYNQYIKTIELITEALAVRLERSPDDPELKITAGAMTGVMMAMLHGAPMSPDALDRGLEFLEAGLPLQ